MDNKSVVASPLPSRAPGSARALLWGPGLPSCSLSRGGRCLRFMRDVLASIQPPRTLPPRVEVGLSEVEAARSGSSARGGLVWGRALSIWEITVWPFSYFKKEQFSPISASGFLLQIGSQGWRGGEGGLLSRRPWGPSLSPGGARALPRGQGWWDNM